MPGTSTLLRLIAAALLGLGLGLFSSWADFLPAQTPLHVLIAMGNAIGPWVAVGFAAGAIQRRTAIGAAGGAISLAAGVAAYYVAALLNWGAGVPSFMSQLILVWLLVALIAGCVTGAAGGSWASSDRYLAFGPALLAGALLAEAAYRFIEVEGWLGIDLARTGVQVTLVDTFGAILVLALLLNRARWPNAVLATLVIGLAGLGAIAGVESLIRAVLGIPGA
jgi:hypothetical protein